VAVINLLNPNMIVIGGGVANSYRFLYPTIRKTIDERAMKIPAQMVKVVKAKLKDDAGIIGALVLVQDGRKKP
jgi:glucokinase